MTLSGLEGNLADRARNLCKVPTGTIVLRDFADLEEQLRRY